MAQLGRNTTVDTISAEHLDQLRKELFGVVPNSTLEAVMIRVADAMHEACTATWIACDADARGVVPSEMI